VKKRTGTQKYFLFLWVVLSLVTDVVHADEETKGIKGLYIPWPQSWQVAPPRTDKSVMYQQARQQNTDKTVQSLQITAINLQHGPKPATPESVKQLATSLRNELGKTAVEKTIPLQEFKTVKGYYFAATDSKPKSGEFTQLVEGVILSEGYLINFSLLTNDASSKDTQAMIAALDQLSIR